MTEGEHLHLLATLALAAGDRRTGADEHLSTLNPSLWNVLASLAAEHHVTIRALGPSTRPQPERHRGQHALTKLHEVCRALEENGCSVVVIKSLDHWPDLGSDFDLLTTSPEETVISTMQNRFGASIEKPSWSDRVAKKINFRLPGLNELVEVHFGRLGQTGEHRKLAKRIMERRVSQEICGMAFWVPAPEERILLTTLQRLYRHFYMRICDVLDTANLIESGAVDFDELRRAAKRCSIWPGTATLLRVISEYVNHYRGEHLRLPRRVWLASAFGMEKILPQAGFLRLPLFPQATKLYLRQLIRTMRRRDTAGSVRLGLVPPLAVAANLRYRITGDEHGIW